MIELLYQQSTGQSNPVEMVSVFMQAGQTVAAPTLAKQQAIPDDYPVPCLVKTDTGDITEISLAENVQHEAMHPADEFVAFAQMITQRAGLEDVAAAFGVTRNSVLKTNDT